MSVLRSLLRVVSIAALVVVLIVALNIRIFNDYLGRGRAIMYSKDGGGGGERRISVLVQEEERQVEPVQASNMVENKFVMTPAAQCRRKLDKWQNANIDRWMDSKVPWMEWMWELTDTSTGKPYWLVMLLTIDTGLGNHYAPKLQKMKWAWQDTRGRVHAATPVFTKRMKQPRNDRVYLRLDPPPQKRKSDGNRTDVPPLEPKTLWANVPDKELNSVQYQLQPYLRCSNLERQQQTPLPSNPKLGACITRFWGQHDLLPEWIEYHRLLGVQHFWMFVSEPFENVMNNTQLPHNAPDVTFIPYHYTWARHQHKRPSERIKFGGENMFQAAAINQCLYLAKQYDLDWIYTPDVDEYVAILDSKLLNDNEAPLPAYLERTYANRTQVDPELGQICMEGVAFGRNLDVEPLEDVVNNDEFQLTIDFTYRLNRTLGATGGRRKCFYRTSVVNDAWIHLARDGGTSINTNPNQVDLNHYRTPLRGVFQHHGNSSDLVSYPEIRDRYRDKMLSALRESNLQLPNFTKHVDLGYHHGVNDTTTTSSPQ